MMLSDEVETSPLHQQVFTFEFLLLNVGIESFLLALICHGIGALASSTSHYVSCLLNHINKSLKCKTNNPLLCSCV